MWPKTHKVRRPIPFFASTKIAKCVLYAAATYVANALASIGCERATEPITAKRAEGYPLEFQERCSEQARKRVIEMDVLDERGRPSALGLNPGILFVC
jgi:hypothetical protein